VHSRVSENINISIISLVLLNRGNIFEPLEVCNARFMTLPKEPHCLSKEAARNIPLLCSLSLIIFRYCGSLLRVLSSRKLDCGFKVFLMRFAFAVRCHIDLCSVSQCFATPSSKGHWSQGAVACYNGSFYFRRQVIAVIDAFIFHISGITW
jgi:hypothetical protein